MGKIERIAIQILVRTRSINRLTVMYITDFIHMKTVLMKDVEIALKDVETELNEVETALKDV